MTDDATRHALAHGPDHIVSRNSLVDAVRNPRCGNLVERGASLQISRLEPIHLLEAVIGDDDTLLCVEHDQPLDHVVQGRIEQLPVPFDLLVGSLELCERPVEDPDRQSGEGEIGPDRKQDRSQDHERGPSQWHAGGDIRAVRCSSGGEQAHGVADGNRGGRQKSSRYAQHPEKPAGAPGLNVREGCDETLASNRPKALQRLGWHTGSRALPTDVGHAGSPDFPTRPQLSRGAPNSSFQWGTLRKTRTVMENNG
jgi:hypothetical protein